MEGACFHGSLPTYPSPQGSNRNLPHDLAQALPLAGLRISTLAQSLGSLGLSHQALTLLGIWSHFLHKLNEVFQELGVVV